MPIKAVVTTLSLYVIVDHQETMLSYKSLLSVQLRHNMTRRRALLQIDNDTSVMSCSLLSLTMERNILLKSQVL